MLVMFDIREYDKLEMFPIIASLMDKIPAVHQSNATVDVVWIVVAVEISAQ